MHPYFAQSKTFSEAPGTHLTLEGFQQKGDLVESDKYSEAKVGAFERGGHISEVFPYQ